MLVGIAKFANVAPLTADPPVQSVEVVYHWYFTPAHVARTVRVAGLAALGQTLYAVLFVWLVVHVGVQASVL